MIEDAPRIVIFGNSGSGKSTLARKIAGERPVLDLDLIVWEPGKIAVRRAEEEILMDFYRFLSQEKWVVEGCYGDLVEASFYRDPLLIFLDPGEEVCLEHCRMRSFEPQKYASKEDQDAMLSFLLNWVQEYYHRKGAMSHQKHQELFERYPGKKIKNM